MANTSKLFKKLNEQMEVNSIKNKSATITEAEKEEVEKKVVFENSTMKLAENLKIK